MQKIGFCERYMLTTAVLNRTKELTRRLEKALERAVAEYVKKYGEPFEFAVHNSTCYTIAKYVCEELREDLNSLPAEQPSEEVNKEIDRFLADNVGKTITVGHVAHYFANWQ